MFHTSHMPGDDELGDSVVNSLCQRMMAYDVKENAGLLQVPWLGFDTETTGVNPQKDHIITASLVLYEPRQGEEIDSSLEYDPSNNAVEVANWVINPHVPIPPAATAIHGYTTQDVEREGKEPTVCLKAIMSILLTAVGQGIPLVAFNGAYDIEILIHNLRMWGLPDLSQQAPQASWIFLDPLVIDRALDRYRRGPRRLVNVSKHYQISVNGQLHHAQADTTVTLGVLDALVHSYDLLRNKSLAELMLWQSHEYTAWADNFNEWRKKRGIALVNTKWRIEELLPYVHPRIL